jgi:monoterpene epsilon-lactone hydrolase
VILYFHGGGYSTGSINSHRVYLWLIEEQGIHPDHIVMGGESAGAGLTLSTLVSLRDERLPLPAGGVLISGWLDLDPRSTSMQFNRHYDFVTRIGIRSMAKRFAPVADHRNPLVSPVHADMSGLPPLLIQVGAAETLLDDNLRCAEAARSAGVEVKLEVWPDMIHAWHVFAPMLEEGRQAIQRIGDFVKGRTAQ